MRSIGNAAEAVVRVENIKVDEYHARCDERMMCLGARYAMECDIFNEER